ncbi:TlpA disulfide reductase family protein [Pseudoduganella violaceinigra]|uniref:TlpA disulfide reductase family protein n=1 Tax=Pseudoduganella violaceinigra TaxID=246602 RepID=UPI000482CA22|nr:TlpA disulfide reductase family protein [Pseudoduganella violaceinigra]
MKKILMYGAVAVLFTGAGAWFALHTPPADGPVAAVASPGNPVTALLAETLPNEKGEQEALSKWQGKPLLVNFWASWCGPCVEEMPELSELQNSELGKKVQVLGIGIDSPSNIAEFTQKVKVAYPIYVAGMSGTELSRKFGNTQGGLPFTVLIGADGTVKKTYLARLKFDALKADLAGFN